MEHHARHLRREFERAFSVDGRSDVSREAPLLIAVDCIHRLVDDECAVFVWQGRAATTAMTCFRSHRLLKQAPAEPGLRDGLRDRWDQLPYFVGPKDSRYRIGVFVRRCGSEQWEPAEQALSVLDGWCREFPEKWAELAEILSSGPPELVLDPLVAPCGGASPAPLGAEGEAFFREFRVWLEEEAWELREYHLTAVARYIDGAWRTKPYGYTARQFVLDEPERELELAIPLADGEESYFDNPALSGFVYQRRVLAEELVRIADPATSGLDLAKARAQAEVGRWARQRLFLGRTVSLLYAPIHIGGCPTIAFYAFASTESGESCCLCTPAVHVLQRLAPGLKAFCQDYHSGRVRSILAEEREEARANQRLRALAQVLPFPAVEVSLERPRDRLTGWRQVSVGDETRWFRTVQNPWHPCQMPSAQLGFTARLEMAMEPLSHIGVLPAPVAGSTSPKPPSSTAGAPQQLRQPRGAYPEIIGESPAMSEVLRLLDKIVRSEDPVLIMGESGTGKELIARAIHQNGPRAHKSFLSENCAALTDTLLESELFGHVRGSFTGATRDKKGLFELADEGTLFLDEVGDMRPEMQTRLLRALQEGEIRPVGGTTVRKVDVRVISASNKDLEQLVRAGKFREDLYYRVNVLTVCLPPLRKRKEDIPLLLDHFLRLHRSQGRTIGALSAEVVEILKAYDWPGNIRELQNEVKRMQALGDEIICSDVLSEQVRRGATGRVLGEEEGVQEVPASRPQGLEHNRLSLTREQQRLRQVGARLAMALGGGDKVKAGAVSRNGEMCAYMSRLLQQLAGEGNWSRVLAFTTCGTMDALFAQVRRSLEHEPVLRERNLLAELEDLGMSLILPF